ncbi:hypothetical protein BCM14_2457 [Jezberella montanilacus]|uniref:Uncharacterized protein n=1 Tax=Jezberella montanilacus TaxID=323426 RepID=A0A2T0XEH1_9BURK|nr:hypothetical protein [Jezberella montanilacus]PRY97311.1 hypothetical protein BCM14_2457 [Jezberella montanilacus]
MARARNIKPSFFTNELLGTEDPMVSLTFAGLWCLADKEGILEDRPLRIKAELFPYRENLDVNGYLTVLQRLGFIHRYVVNGVGYLQVINFEKHQCPHHTEKSKKYPKYHDVKDLTVKSPLSAGEKQVPTRSDSLIHDSLIPDSLIEDSLIPDSPIQGSLPAEEGGTEKIPRPSQTAIVCLALKGEGIGAVSPSNPKLKTLLEAGADVGMFIDAARAAKARGKASFAYIVAVVDGQMQEAQAVAQRARASPAVVTETNYQRSARLRYEEAIGTRAVVHSNVIDITPLQNHLARIA